jgi:hypothetical protein
MSESEGCVLRIATDAWVAQVFNMATYYTSSSTKLKKDQTIIFIHKTDVGDSIVGYGVIQDIVDEEMLSSEEKRQCQKYGWKKAVEFSYVLRFEKPLLVKETFFKDTKLRGRCFQGFRLSKEQVNTLVSQAEKSQRQCLR